MTAVLALGALLLGSCSVGQEETGAVARVNGQHVYEADVNLALARQEQSAMSAGEEADPTSEAEHREAALQTAIENELLFQEAKRRGYAAQAQEVEEQLRSIGAQFPVAQMFDEALSQMGLTREDLRRDLERAQSVQNMIEKSIEPEITVSPEESRAYYDGNPELFTDPERVRASHILIMVGPEAPEADKAKARQTLEGLRARVLRGESFAELARSHSEDPSAGNGGDLGYFARGQTVDSFEQAAFALQVGQTSDVVVTPYGFHLIQLTDRQAAAPVSYERVQESLSGFLRQRKINEAVVELARQLREKAKVKVFKPKSGG